MNKFKGFALAVLLALGLSALAPAMPSPMRDVIVTTASAACGIHQGGECGRDAVFHNNEPRWRGGYGYQNRNYGGGHAGGRHAHRSGYAQGSSRMVAIGTYRRVIRVYRPSAVAVEQPVVRSRARCGAPRCHSRPAVRTACRTGCNPKPQCNTCKGGATSNTAVSGVNVKTTGANSPVNVTVNQQVAAAPAAGVAGASAGANASIEDLAATYVGTAVEGGKTVFQYRTSRSVVNMDMQRRSDADKIRYLPNGQRVWVKG